MASYDFTRMKRLIIIYRILQGVLILLLLYMALSMNTGFAALGSTHLFIKSIILGVITQAILFYPALVLARQEVMVNLDSALQGQDGEALKAIRNRRLYGDICKICFIGFFGTFIMLIPGAEKGIGARVILSSALLGFLLVLISYFQCFNFLATRKIKEITAR